MNAKSAAIMSMVLVGSAFALSNASFAFCGVIKKTATGPTANAATQKANNAGLIEVRKLEKSYGANKIAYKPANVTCAGSATLGAKANPFSCTITQNFCTK